MTLIMGKRSASIVVGPATARKFKGKNIPSTKISCNLNSAKLSEQKRAQNGLGTQGITFEVFCLNFLVGYP